MKLYLSENGKTPVSCSGAGILLDDINYAIDGGLYAEMLENRNFEAQEVRREKDGVAVKDDGAYAWEAYPSAAEAVLKVKTDRPLFPENPHYMRLTVSAEGAGMANKGYGGIAVKKKEEYRLSFYVRSYNYKGAAYAGVYEGETAVFTAKIKVKADGQWRRVSFRVKSKTDAENARFRFTLAKAGTIHLDGFSLMPADAIFGVFRRDIVHLLKDLKPAYLRFPCTETDGENNPYLWKNSIGQTERRKHAWNTWALRSYPHYGQTLGVGYFEYFRLAEYLGAHPIPVLGRIPEEEESFEAFVQDAADVLEFAEGKADTLFGRVRAEMGRHEPFTLKYLAVTVQACGKNKKSGPESDVLFERFKARVWELNPNVNVVAAECVKESEITADPALNNWESALREAEEMVASAYGEEIYAAKSYLPALAREGTVQHSPCLICFDGKTAYCSAHYFVRKLFNLYCGDNAIEVKTDGAHAIASATERGAFTYVNIVNAGNEPVEAEAEGNYDFGALARIISLTAESNDLNALLDPERIVPRDVAPSDERTFTLAPRSYNVLVFKK